MASRRPSAQTLGALAVARLMLGDFDAAIANLEELTRLPTASAATHNDLAAAYLARAAHGERAVDAARALTVVERARAADPTSASVLFTRALSLEALHLDEQAREAWRDYVRKWPAGEWTSEARVHLGALERISRHDQWAAERPRLIEHATHGDLAHTQAIVSAFREATRELLDDELLPELGGAIVAGRDDSGLRTRVSTVAAALSAVTQDQLPARSAAALIAGSAAAPSWRNSRAGASAGDRSMARRRVAQGHVVWREARRAFNAYRFAEAVTLFVRCEQDLDAGASPFVLWAQFQHAVAAYQLRHLETSQSLLQRVLSTAGPAQYHGVAARAHWVLGSIRSNAGAFSLADSEFRVARRAFERAGDGENVANVNNLLAENYGWLGEPDEGWAHLVSALEMFDALRDPRRRQAMMYVGGVLAMRQRLLEVGLLFQAGYLEAARDAGVSASIAEGLVRRAATFQQLAEFDRARQDLGEARRLAESADRSQAEWIRALASEVEGELWRRRDPTRSRQEIDAAIAYARRADRANRLPTLWLARGRTSRALGQPAEAEDDYQNGLTTFEGLYRGIATESMRLSFFDQAWDLYADMTDLLSAGPGVERALTIADRGRARDLTAPVAVEGADDVLARVRAALDAETSIVFYSSLEERLLIWVVRHDAVHLLSRPLGATQLERRVDACRTAVMSGAEAGVPVRDETGATACAGLYRDLLEPLETFIATSGRLLIVPDGSLHALPFAALRTPRGQYLSAERAVSSVPNLTFLAHAAAARPSGAPPASPATHALIVGNPTLRGDAVSRLPSLTYAASEARAIRSLYPSVNWLDGDAATKTAFVQAIGGADVVHFAGHAVPVANFPGLSRLIFAPAHNGEASEGLDAREIATLRMSRTRLVVLAACRTATGSMRYRAEGPMSLARPFLAAGVRSVVGTLWDVDDYASSVFFTRFHAALAHGASAVGALQQAQRSLMQDSDAALRRPGAWAGMVAYGW